ncbi:MAG: hypothetical protein II350_09390 [Clostridia bacterium]|nr:hypothetical protein [Clostridia bacterium]
MYQGRDQVKSNAENKAVRRRKRKRLLLLTLSIALLLGVAGGATFAYLISNGGSVENSFLPGEVLCSVDDNFAVTNDGNVDAYIRAAVVVNWGNAAGDINGFAPVQQIIDDQNSVVTSGDYELTLGDGWEKIGEYYYYKSVVPFEGAAEKTTPVVEVKQHGTAPDGFNLVVEVIAEAIQAEGTNGTKTAVEDAWGITLPNAD